MPTLAHFFDEATSTLTYAVHDDGAAVVIDPVRSYDPRSGHTAWDSTEPVARYLDARGLEVRYVIDTHAHADHLSGLPFFAERYGARTVTGSRVGEVQAVFQDVYGLGSDFPTDGRPFDVLLEEGEKLGAGSFEVEALHTPGHTPAHMSWRIGDAVFLGDTLFMPDYGSARCDFPGGSAAELYDSIQRLYRLPDATRLFVCHDYRPGGRPRRSRPRWGSRRRTTCSAMPAPPARNTWPSARPGIRSSRCRPFCSPPSR